MKRLDTGMSSSKLFQPTKLGNLALKHRVVLAPCTRLRARPAPSLAPLPGIVKEYYVQRARIPGTLLISEGTNVSAKYSGYPSSPGIWSEEQIAAWKDVSMSGHTRQRPLLTTWLSDR